MICIRKMLEQEAKHRNLPATDLFVDYLRKKNEAEEKTSIQRVFNKAKNKNKLKGI